MMAWKKERLPFLSNSFYSRVRVRQPIGDAHVIFAVSQSKPFSPGANVAQRQAAWRYLTDTALTPAIFVKVRQATIYKHVTLLRARWVRWDHRSSVSRDRGGYVLPKLRCEEKTAREVMF